MTSDSSDQNSGNLIYLLKSVGIYCISAFCGICFHLLITLPSVFFLFTRENPYSWIYSCRRALLVALSTSSSVRPMLFPCLIIVGCHSTGFNCMCGRNRPCFLVSGKYHSSNGGECEHGWSCNIFPLCGFIPCKLREYR